MMIIVLVVLVAPAVKKNTKKKFFATKKMNCCHIFKLKRQDSCVIITIFATLNARGPERPMCGIIEHAQGWCKETGNGGGNTRIVSGC